jgi:BirA family biotin operon repressor/biotin-[acetyl-CoA-carboxylase] ligase
LIKWPNDIYVLEKKLCGILIENSLSGGRIQHSIIGIGMNINETRFAPDLPNAISLGMITGNDYDIEWIARKIREEVMSVLHQPSPHWKAEYDQYVFGKGQSFQFESGNTSFKAIVTGISMEGKLILLMNDGKFESFSTHEVKWVL